MPTAYVSVMQASKLHIGPVAPGGVDVDCQINTAELNPTTTLPTYDTVCGQVQVVGVTAWVLHVIGLQDWTADGWCTYLNENAGKVEPFTFQPLNAAQPTAAGEVFLAPAKFGGQAGQPLPAEASLPVVAGSLVFTPAA